LFIEEGQVAELRIPNAGRAGTVSGYFNDIELMAKAAAFWSGKAPGVYFTLNPVKADHLARANNRLRQNVKSGDATDDNGIERRVILPLDFDAVRLEGISSTD